MGYGYGRAFRNSGISRLSTYKDAKEWHDRTKPIKAIKNKDGTTNTNAGKRPLGHRNRPWFEIKMGADESVECSAYRDDVVVKFTKDGEIHIKNSRYISTTTSHFLEDVLGSGWWAGISFFVHDYAIKVEVRRLDGEIETHRLGAEETLKLRLYNKSENPNDYTNRWEVLNPQLTKTHTVNRQVMKELKAKYQKVYTFARQYCKLLGDEVVVTREEDSTFEEDLKTFRVYGGWYSATEAFVSATNKLHTLIQGSKDKEAEVEGFIKVLKVLTATSGTYSWKNSMHSANYDRLKELIDILIMGIHRSEVLESKLDDTGRRRDRYGYLFRRGWEKYHEAKKA